MNNYFFYRIEKWNTHPMMMKLTLVQSSGAHSHERGSLLDVEMVDLIHFTSSPFLSKGSQNVLGKLREDVRNSIWTSSSNKLENPKLIS
jgi:hypothetical protein